LSKIEFGKPYLRKVRRVIEYELDGLAFVEGYEKTVGFTFECGYSGRNWRLTMEDLYQSKEVYNFFNNLLKDYSEEELGIRKSIMGLYAEWNIVEGRVQDVLERIGETMGNEWKEAFKTIISVYE